VGWGMKQLTLATMGFERYAKTTRRAAFLAEMERVVPWSALSGLIEPFYPKPGNGRPPVGVEPMLRLYFLQQWFNLSDPAVEEAQCDSQAMRRFVGIDLRREPVPDETTVCRFRHLLERTLIASLSPVRSPTYLSRAGIYCAALWRDLSGLAIRGCGSRQRYTKYGTADPTISFTAAISMASITHSCLFRPSLTRLPNGRSRCGRTGAN
jgi:hypothetical protein